MVLSEAEEQQPLLVDGLRGDNRKGSYTYHALCTEQEVNSILNSSHQSISSEKVSPFEIAYDTGNSGSESPPGFQECQQRVVPSEGIRYTWNDINVFTTSVQKRRQPLWRNLKDLFKRDRKILPEERKHILKNVNGVAYPGELLAIMGSSGAGKTTLLNTLTFRSSSNTDVSGVRAINNYPVTSNTITSLSAYVQQEDLFIGTLTVREHLTFQALVRMDRDIPYKQRMRRVDEVICELALTKCENTIIGVPGRIKGISGGEMKRLSFASEVLTNPPLMFCDEPTSGLDSFMAQNVVSVLKSMALKGKTVICTIHQPSSEMFAMFDKILLLAEGRTAYLGKPDSACSFFAELGASCPINYNPADFFIQLLAVVPNKEETCRQTIELICDSFDQSPAGIKLANEVELKPEVQVKVAFAGDWNDFDVWNESHWPAISHKERSPYKASWWAQFWAVLWRSWLSVIKEPRLVKVRLMQTMMVSFVISIIYYQQKLNRDGVMNINGALFTFLTNMTFQNVFAVINVFCAELPVFMREHFNGMYRVDVYFLCKTLAEVPVFLAIPITFTAITYFMIGLNPGFGHFLAAIVIISLVANVATSFGYLISCVSSGVTMALSIGPPVIIPFLLFGGFLLNSRSVPTYFTWLSYLSWFKYGNEALLINQWSDVDRIECDASNETCPKTGKIVLEIYGFEKNNLSFDIMALVVLIVLFRFLAYLVLLLRTLRKE